MVREDKGGGERKRLGRVLEGEVVWRRDSGV